MEFAGYAAIDAIVALLIISATVGLGIRGMNYSGRVSEESLRVANVLRTGDWAMMTGSPSGNAAGVDWTVREQSLGAMRPIALCGRVSDLRAGSRHYEISTVVTCADQAP